jgi:hypothetical protein
MIARDRRHEFLTYNNQRVRRLQNTMQRIAAVILSGLLTVAAHGQTASTPYTWKPVDPALTVARADACGAALQDGSAIISGGIAAAGSVLASADVFQPAIGFSTAPAMNNARAAHTCTTLEDGRILVAGGNDGQGNPVGTAEIYDPATQSWDIVSDLNDPRWGHTATLLNDGRVLIAGGQDSYGPKDTLEIFDPTAVAFLPVPASLSTPRMNFAAALLPDGLVAIMGGSNGANSLSSVDIFDPDLNTILAAAPLQAARAFLSANTLPDGTVLAAGGFDGQQDLNTAEVYDIHKGSAFAFGRLNTARHGHLGMTLPGNGNILIMAGIGANTPLAGSELYNFPEGTFTAVGSLATPRARTTATPVGDGLVLSAGGVSTDGVTPIRNCGLFFPPSLFWTVTGNAAPYTGTLAIQGFGFGAGTVNFQLGIVNRLSNFTQTLTSTSTTTGNFNIVSSTLSPPGFSGNWTLTASIKGSPTLEAALRRPVVFASVALSASCNPCDFGQTLTLTATVGNPESKAFPAAPAGGDFVTFNDGATRLNAGATSATNPSASRTESLSPGVHQLTAALSGGSDGFVGVSSPLALKINPIPTSISVSASPDPVLTGSTVTLNATIAFDKTLAAKLGKPATGVINIAVGQVVRSVMVGQPLSIPAPSPGTYPISAAYNGDNNFAASSSPQVMLIVTSPPQTPPGGFIGVFEPSAVWSIVSVSPAATPSVFSFGAPSLKPVVGDWTGSGHSGIGVFDPSTGTWFLRNERSSGLPDAGQFVFGAPGVAVVPVTGDWDGNGTTTIGLFDPSTANWLLKNQNSGGLSEANLFQFGSAGSKLIPVTGDWDGNGTTTIGLFDPATANWTLRNANSAGAPDAGEFKFGGPGMIPVTGNWTGTRRTGIGVFDPKTGNWFLRNSPSSGTADFTFTLGGANSIPIAGKR